MTPEKRRLLILAGYSDAAEHIENGECPKCGGKVDKTRLNPAELVNFELSGMCSECQKKRYR